MTVAEEQAGSAVRRSMLEVELRFAGAQPRNDGRERLHTKLKPQPVENLIGRQLVKLRLQLRQSFLSNPRDVPL